jgi:hypothetical protein
MGITWFDSKEREGVASLYDNNITLNVEASVPFEYAYRVKVGVDEKKNIVIAPLSKERVLRGDLDEYSLLEIAYKRSYSRICSTSLMKRIAAETGLTLSKEAKRFATSWDEDDNLLTIHLDKEG